MRSASFRLALVAMLSVFVLSLVAGCGGEQPKPDAGGTYYEGPMKAKGAPGGTPGGGTDAGTK